LPIGGQGIIFTNSKKFSHRFLDRMQLATPESTVGFAPYTFLDPEFYTDRKWLSIEQKLIFGMNWIYVGQASGLPETGSTMTAEVGGSRIIITRNAAGELKAFHNVCAHRASPLRSNGNGDRSCLVCPYHGWVYDLDGQLAGLPGRKYFPDTDNLDKYQLQSVRVSEWQSFIFVCLNEFTPPLEQFLGIAATMMAGYPFSQMQRFIDKSLVINCNWKAYHDNSLCDYHVNVAHRDTLKASHGLTKFYQHDHDPYVNLLLSPADAAYRATLVNPPVVAPFGDATYTFGIFPNMHLVVIPDGTLWIERVDPVTIDTCRVYTEAYTLFPESTDAPAVDEWYDYLFSQDQSLAEGVQEGYQSGVYQPGMASQLECRIAHHQNVYREAMGV
jgi:phenylpropionate dioxygenase-like ring-hydroxylating dioxygenase large terminal subunit